MREFDSFILRFGNVNPWTSTLGLARSLLALSTFLTFAFTDTHNLFRPAAGISDVPMCNGLSGQIGLFCLLKTNLFLAKSIATVILLIVIIGYRPRFTCILHWWVHWSYMNSSILVDGGDQVNSVLTLLLIPISIFDTRKWHWNKAENVTNNIYILLLCKFVLVAIRIQVSIIYLHAGIAKCNVAEWSNGTVLYYWFLDPNFGYASWLEPFIYPIIDSNLMLTVLTWGIVVLEFFLFAGIIADKKYYTPLLWAGVSFHLGIALIHGLVSFAISMTAALILYFNKNWLKR